MQKNAPSFGRIAVMVVFALSCFGLLLFLWLAFGGAIPLKPQGYRISTSFGEATQLAQEADVRISGVPVGKVKTIEPDRRTGRSEVSLELDAKYAPLPSDARALLRQKTLLGETYVELTPGSRSAPPIPEGGRLPDGQVSETVELDEIFRTFDAPTRRAFQNWMQTQAAGLAGRGRDLNDALSNLDGFAESANRLVSVLDRQDVAVRRVVSNTGIVFDALTERQGQLRDLITSSDDVFATTARRNAQLKETFIALPTFEKESTETIERLTEFADDTDPLVTQLRPAARELGPTMAGLNDLAPQLENLFDGLGPLISASKAGFPATESILDDLRPLLGQITPTSQQLIPILDFVGLYKPELTAFLGNVVASTQVTSGEKHYLRTTNPLNPEGLAVYPNRLRTNRPNPYMAPGGFNNLPNGLEVFENRQCPNGPFPALSQAPSPYIGPQLNAQVQQFAFPPGDPAPPCRKQAAQTFQGETTQYPHVRAQPAP